MSVLVRNGPTPSFIPRSSSVSDVASSQASLQNNGKQNILGSAIELSRDEWPRTSIPRRVKKLSWEDESALNTDRDVGGTLYLDPNVSVTPMREDKGRNYDPNQAMFF